MHFREVRSIIVRICNNLPYIILKYKIEKNS